MMEDLMILSVPVDIMDTNIQFVKRNSKWFFPFVGWAKAHNFSPK